MAEPALDASAKRFVSIDALRVTLGRPSVWLLVFAIEVLLALVPALVYHGWIHGAIAQRYEPGALFANLETSFRFDHRHQIEQLDASIGRVGAMLALLAMLFGCFCAGGWLQVFLERTRGESLRRFFFGGARYFWRFFRLLLVSLVTLALFGWIIYGWPWNQMVLAWIFDVPARDFSQLETLSSEATAVTLRFVQHGLFALAFGLVFTWGDYTRTRLALHDTSSAVWAGACTWYTILRHPVKALAPMLWLFAFEFALVFGLGIFARSIEADLVRRPEAVGIGTLFAVGQLALVWRVILRGSRYHAAVQVSREIVSPIARPDPWKASIGGPGGPRYPLDAEDEFVVSM